MAVGQHWSKMRSSGRIVGRCRLSFPREANDRWEFRADFRGLPDLWGRTKVEFESSVPLANPNLSCPHLEVEGNLFLDLHRGIRRGEYLHANLRCSGKACFVICLLAASRPEPCHVDGFNTVWG